jgi:PPOX class probable F420-dependent enzyme
VLATTHVDRGADLVPVCFVTDGEFVAVPVDTVKPKASTDLQRLRNLDADPRATILCDHWDNDDWTQLWWVRATLIRTDTDADLPGPWEAPLRAKYHQYAGQSFAAIIVFRITDISGWAATS